MKNIWFTRILFEFSCFRSFLQEGKSSPAPPFSKPVWFTRILFKNSCFRSFLQEGKSSPAPPFSKPVWFTRILFKNSCFRSFLQEGKSSPAPPFSKPVWFTLILFVFFLIGTACSRSDSGSVTKPKQTTTPPPPVSAPYKPVVSPAPVSASAPAPPSALAPAPVSAPVSAPAPVSASLPKTSASSDPAPSAEGFLVNIGHALSGIENAPVTAVTDKAGSEENQAQALKQALLPESKGKKEEAGSAENQGLQIHPILEITDEDKAFFKNQLKRLQEGPSKDEIFIQEALKKLKTTEENQLPKVPLRETIPDKEQDISEGIQGIVHRTYKDYPITDRKPCRGSIKEMVKYPHCRVPKWLKEAETEGETVLITEEGKVIWEKGTWNLGAWRGDIWKEGLWKGGTFYSGIWEKGTWLRGDWRGYIWHSGIWKKGEWQLGIWKGGVFEDGIFRRGIWQDGEWSGTNMTAGLWEKGIWHKGGFVRSLWMNGMWYGDAESWTKDSAFRDSLWRYGVWNGGDFWSGIWENGIWYGGEFHKGVWKNGIFKGGLWWELSDSFWQCGIWEGGQWGWPSWFAHYDRVNSSDCDTSKSGVPPAFLTEERTYTFLPEEQIYRCADCPSSEKKLYHLKPGCRGTIKELSYKSECAVPQWLKEANTLGETVAITSDNTVIWEDGVWHNGHWKGGIWKHGVFANGIWEDGIWENGMWGDNIIQGYAGGGGMWVTGVWKNGLFREGLWMNGLWKHGYHVNGDWFGGIWEDGKWENGTWYRGKNVEVTGEWHWWNRLAKTEKRTLPEAMGYHESEEYFAARPEIRKRWEEIKKAHELLEGTKGEKIKKGSLLGSRWTDRL